MALSLLSESIIGTYQCSVRIENFEDILEDLNQALQAV